MPALKTFNVEKATQFAHDFEAAFGKGDYRAIASYYAENATLIADHSVTLQGRQPIERFWQTLCRQYAEDRIRRTIHIQNVDTSSDLAYILGSVYLETPVSDDETNVITIRFATLWKRQPDGVWRLALDISTRNPSSLNVSQLAVPPQTQIA